MPLRLEPRYVPDGWLGIIVGTRLYFDFTSPRDYDHVMTTLLRELGSRGRLCDTVDSSRGMVTRDTLYSGAIPRLLNYLFIVYLCTCYLHSSSLGAVRQDTHEPNKNSLDLDQQWTTEQLRIWLDSCHFTAANERYVYILL